MCARQVSFRCKRSKETVTPTSSPAFGRPPLPAPSDKTFRAIFHLFCPRLCEVRFIPLPVLPTRKRKLSDLLKLPPHHFRREDQISCHKRISSFHSLPHVTQTLPSRMLGHLELLGSLDAALTIPLTGRHQRGAGARPTAHSARETSRRDVGSFASGQQFIPRLGSQRRDRCGCLGLYWWSHLIDRSLDFRVCKELATSCAARSWTGLR